MKGSYLNLSYIARRSQNPWRNETMHVSGKYTDDEAKHIFAAVEDFLKKLSAWMDKKREPKA